MKTNYIFIYNIKIVKNYLFLSVTGRAQKVKGNLLPSEN